MDVIVYRGGSRKGGGGGGGGGGVTGPNSARGKPLMFLLTLFCAIL